PAKADTRASCHSLRASAHVPILAIAPAPLRRHFGTRPGCGRPGSARPAPELVGRWTRLGGGAGWRLRRAGGGSLDRVRSAADADGEIDGDAHGAVGGGRDDVQRELAGVHVLEGETRGE